jgi:hypothetical protein
MAMRVLFDQNWTPELAPQSEDPKTVENFLSLEKTAERIDSAIQRTFVWAKDPDLGGEKYIVRDVRILCETEQVRENLYAEITRLQVLLLEGWRTPERVWTDEESIEVIEGVQ